MKKTLVALAVAAVAATSANAAVVYNQDGSKVEVNGSLRVLLKKETDKRADLVNNGSRVIFKAEQVIGNGLSAFGEAQLRFDGNIKDEDKSKNTFGDPNLNKLYAGLKQEGVGALSFGRQATTGDDVQLGDYTYVWGGNSNLEGSAKKLVKFRSADFNGFSFGLDYAFGDSNKDANDGLKNAYGASLFYTAALAQDVKLNTAAGYQQIKDLDGETAINWRLAAELESGPFALAYNYGQSKTKGQDDKTVYHLVGAKYAVVDASTLYAQWNSEKETDEARINKYIVGADYKLHKNVVTFVEYARVKQDKSENAFGVGLRVHF